MSQPLGQFQPRGAVGATPVAQTSIAVTTAVQQLALPPVPAEGATLRLVADGTSSIAWAYGSSAGLTMLNGVPMLPNTVETFAVPGGTTAISVIGSAAGTTLRATVGDGL